MDEQKMGGEAGANVGRGSGVGMDNVEMGGIEEVGTSVVTNRVEGVEMGVTNRAEGVEMQMAGGVGTVKDVARDNNGGDDDLAQFSDSRLIAAAVLAFMYGGLGIHDFILKRYKKGIAHVVMAVVIFVAAIVFAYSMYAALTTRRNMDFYDNISDVAIMLGGGLAIVSSIWGVVEGIQIIQVIRERNKKGVETGENRLK